MHRAGQRPERIAELMAQHGDELVLRRVGSAKRLLLTLERSVLALGELLSLPYSKARLAKCLLQPRDFLDAARCFNLDVIAAAHGRRGPRKRRNRRFDPARNQPGEDEREDERGE